MMKSNAIVLIPGTWKFRLFHCFRLA